MGQPCLHDLSVSLPWSIAWGGGNSETPVLCAWTSVIWSQGPGVVVQNQDNHERKPGIPL